MPVGSNGFSSLLLIPPVLAGLSVVYIGFKILTVRPPHHSILNERLLPGQDRDDSVSAINKSCSTLAEIVHDYDGSAIIFFRVLRLLAIAALLTLQVFDINSKNGSGAIIYLQLLLLVSQFNQ